MFDDPPRTLAHWTFDDTLADATGNGNDGSFAGYWTALYATGYDCTVQGAARFEGDDYVRAVSADGIPVYNAPAYSIAMWVKADVQKDKRVYSESNTSGNNTPLFNIGTDNDGATGVVDLFLRGDSVTPMNHRKSVGIAFDNTWHHLVWVDANGTAALYIDGAQDATDFNYTKPVMSVDTATIGGILRGTACCQLIGAIDDVRVFNYILSEEDIAALAVTPPECEAEVRVLAGDCNADGALNVTDIICGIKLTVPGFYLLDDTPVLPPCTTEEGNAALLDVNGDNAANLSDVSFMAMYLFYGGNAPAQGENCFGLAESAGCAATESCDG